MQAIKLMVKLLQSQKIPKYVYPSTYGYQQSFVSQRNLSEFVKFLAEDHDLINKLVDDL